MIRNLALAGVAALGLSACSLGSTPPENFYTLSAQLNDDAGMAPRALNGKRVEVVLTHIDELVDRPQWVVRVAPNQVKILEQQRWGEALKTQIPQVIAENLQRYLPHARISALPASAPSDVRVLLDVQKFEAWPDQIELEISWRLLDAKRQVLKEMLTKLVLPVTNEGGETQYAAIALAQSKGLSRVSVEIANALRQLSLPPARSSP